MHIIYVYILVIKYLPYYGSIYCTLYVCMYVCTFIILMWCQVLELNEADYSDRVSGAGNDIQSHGSSPTLPLRLHHHRHEALWREVRVQYEQYVGTYIHTILVCVH